MEDEDTFTFFTFFFFFLQLYCPSGISPLGNLGCFPRGNEDTGGEYEFPVGSAVCTEDTGDEYEFPVGSAVHVHLCIVSSPGNCAEYLYIFRGG